MGTRKKEKGKKMVGVEKRGRKKGKKKNRKKKTSNQLRKQLAKDGKKMDEK